MARLWQSGFELNSTSAGVEWSTVSGGTIVTSPVRSGNYAGRINSSGSYFAFTAQIQGVRYYRFYFRIASAPSAITPFFMCNGGLGSQRAALKLTTSRTIQLWNTEDNVQVGSDSDVLELDTWYRVEMKMDNTTLASTALEARLEGVSFASGTVNHSGNVAEVRFNNNIGVTADMYFDDFAMNDDTPAAMETYYVDGHVAGASDPFNAWTNDANAFDGDLTTFAYTTETFEGKPLRADGTNAPSSGGTISSVKVRAFSRHSLISVVVPLTINIYTSTDEALGSVTSASQYAHWGDYATLATPTGGWTWEKIQNLYATADVFSNLDSFIAPLARIDIAVVISGIQDSWCGEGSIIHLTPNGAGDLAESDRGGTDSGANWSQVDEVTPNDITDYLILQGFSNRRNHFNLTDTPAELSSASIISTVAYGIRWRLASTSGELGKLRMRIVESTYSYIDILVDGSTASWSTYSHVNPRHLPLVAYNQISNPDPWDKTTIDALQVGVQEHGLASADHVQVSTLWISIDYYTPILSLFTRQAKATLPTTDAHLATFYTSGEEADVATDDGVRVGIVATTVGTLPYGIHQYKFEHTNNTDPINVSWNGQSDLAPTASTVYLQIYNYNTDLWETLDSEASASANTDFTLSGVQSASVANYYDGVSNTVTVRVYQFRN